MSKKLPILAVLLLSFFLQESSGQTNLSDLKDTQVIGYDNDPTGFSRLNNTTILLTGAGGLQASAVGSNSGNFQIGRAGTLIFSLGDGTTSHTGHFVPTTLGSNTYDLGTSSYLWRTGYFGTSLQVPSITATADLTLAPTDQVYVNADLGVGTASPQDDFEVRGTDSSEANVYISTSKTALLSTQALGRIYFNAPLESDGSDAILPGAAIVATATSAFSATVNETSLSFQTAESGALSTQITIGATGTVNFATGNITTGIDTDLTLAPNGTGDVELTSCDLNFSGASSITTTSGTLTLQPGGNISMIADGGTIYMYDTLAFSGQTISFNSGSNQYLKNTVGTSSSHSFIFRFSDNEEVLKVRGDGAIFVGDRVACKRITMGFQTEDHSSGTALAVTSGTLNLTGDGAQTVTTITGAIEGQRLVILCGDADVTITDTDAHTANTVDLAGTATDFTSADDTVLEIIFDGTSWYEISRSVN